MHTYEGKDLTIQYNSDLSGNFHIHNKATGQDTILPAEDLVDFIKNEVIRDLIEDILYKLIK